MRRVKGLFVIPICFAIMMTSVPAATADCIKNAEDAVFAVLSGGLSTAACEISELVQAIKGFIQTVNDLSSKVKSNFDSVSNNSVAAVDRAADKIASSGSTAQTDLSKDVAEAKAMASSFAMAPRANVQMPVAPNHAAMAPRTNVQMPGMSRNMAAGQARSAQGAAQPPVNRMAAAAPMLKQWADPQQLHAALQRGAQRVEALKRTVDQDDMGRINAAAQKARSQAKSHLSDATSIMQTALMAPITALIKTLDDLVRDPKKLLDPIATINTMVDNIVQSIVGTMNKVADVITKDAMSTLAGVEPAVHQAQGTANESANLMGLMRRAYKDKTKAALNALEAKLNAMGMQSGAMIQSRTLATPRGSFRFASIQGTVHASLQQAVAPSQALASHLSSSWAAIRNKHTATASRQLSPSVKQTGQNELDKMFRGKTPAQVAQIKQNLLSRAKLRFGSDPKLMASIEQNLNNYVHVHVVPTPLAARPRQGGGQQGPGTRMLNPQPLPPRSGNFQNQKLPAAQR